MDIQTLATRVMALLFTVLIATTLVACGGADDRKEAHLKKGDTLFAAGDFEKARVEYRNVLQIDPKDLKARFALGETMNRLRDYREAVNYYLSVVEDEPGHLQANQQLAEIFLRARDVVQAQKYVNVLLLADPRHAAALTLSAGIKILQEDLPGARIDIDRALESEPGNINATLLSSRLMLQDGRVDEAVETLERVLVAHQDNTEVRTMLAMVHAQQGDVERAVDRLREIVELEPKTFAHRLTLARFFAANQRMAEAEQVLVTAINDLPKDNSAKLAYIEFLASSNQMDSAVAKLKEMVATNPKEYDLRFSLGRLYSSQRDWPNARQVYDEIIKDTEPDAPQALAANVRLAAVAIQQGSRDEGLKLVNAVLEKNARDREALTLRGSFNLEEKNLTAAIADFRAALSDDPTDLTMLRLLAAAHFANGDKELGRDTLRRAIDAHPGDLQVRAELAQAQTRDNDVPAAIKTLESMLQVQPGHLETMQALYKAKAYQKDLDGALAVAEQIQQAHSNDPLGFHLAGLVQQAKGDYPASIRSFESALALSPDAIQPLSQLVKSHIAMKQNSVAVSRLEEVISQSEKNFVAYNLLGELQILSGDLGRARGNLEKAIELKPDWDIPYNNLAQTQAKGKDDAAAKATFERGIGATDGSALLVTSYAAFMEQRGNLDEAIKQYESMLEKHPDSDLAKNNLAMLLAEYKNDAASIDRARTLTEHFQESTHPAYLDTLGWVEYKAGNFDRAVEHLQKAMEAAPDANMLRYHLGMAYLAQGDSIEALHNLKQAVDSKENFRGIDQAREALSKLERSPAR